MEASCGLCNGSKGMVRRQADMKMAALRHEVDAALFTSVLTPHTAKKNSAKTLRELLGLVSVINPTEDCGVTQIVRAFRDRREDRNPQIGLKLKYASKTILRCYAVSSPWCDESSLQ